MAELDDRGAEALPLRVRSSGEWRREDQWWRDNYGSRPYVSADRGYDYYAPAYRHGYEAVSRFPGRSWSDVEPELRREWERYANRGESPWQEMRDAVRDAWDHVTGHEHAAHGQRDRREDLEGEVP